MFGLSPGPFGNIIIYYIFICFLGKSKLCLAELLYLVTSWPFRACVKAEERPGPGAAGPYPGLRAPGQSAGAWAIIVVFQEQQT